MRSPKLWVVVLLMLFTAVELHLRGDVDRVPPSRPLSEMPSAIGNRTAVDIPIDAETLAILGKGDFLNRVYLWPRNVPVARPGDYADIGLYIAYFATQRSGQSIHSPQNCLPGAGWTFQPPSVVTSFTDSTGKEYRVGDYLITNGSATEEALYWYQLHGESIASDYKAKFSTLADSIRYGRTDEALIRIMTPVAPGEDRAEARRRVIGFAQQITPLLPAYVPN
jgi:EpsI family protein